ncbi:MAG: DUF1109 domain-containing protein [Paracoccaceae bacterium]|nr:MAG: DUF1109 domain-containing protein [Paracoccaceae bacterium]
MKTDDLIAMLATGAEPVRSAGDMRRLLMGLPLALGAAAFAVALWLGFLSPGLWGPSATLPKLIYAAALSGSGLWLLRRLGRPGAPVAVPAAMVATVLGIALASGLADMMSTDAGARSMRLMGKSASQCPLAILALSLPAMAVAMAAARQLAPVRLRLAGAAAGLAAGGLAAMAYALACTEGAPAFIAVWYTLGMLLAAGLGALIGPRALRW